MFLRSFIQILFPAAQPAARAATGRKDEGAFSHPTAYSSPPPSTQNEGVPITMRPFAITTRMPITPMPAQLSFHLVAIWHDHIEVHCHALHCNVIATPTKLEVAVVTPLGVAVAWAWV